MSSLLTLLANTRLWNALKWLEKLPVKAVAKDQRKCLKNVRSVANYAGLIMCSICTGWWFSTIKEIILFECFHFKPSRHGAWWMRRRDHLQISGALRVKLALCEYESLLNCFIFSPPWSLHTDITEHSAVLPWGKLLTASPALDSHQEFSSVRTTQF